MLKETTVSNHNSFLIILCLQINLKSKQNVLGFKMYVLFLTFISPYNIIELHVNIIHNVRVPVITICCQLKLLNKLIGIRKLEIISYCYICLHLHLSSVACFMQTENIIYSHFLQAVYCDDMGVI